MAATAVVRTQPTRINTLLNSSVGPEQARRRKARGQPRRMLNDELHARINQNK
jgi:hypothetical protein